MTLSYIAIYIFTLYLIMIWILYGIPKSISDTYYLTGQKPVFTFIMWITGILVFIDAPNIWINFAAIFVAAVGTAAGFKEKLTKPIHYISAVLAIVFGLIGLNCWVLLLGFFIVSYIIVIVSDKWMWWVEILAFYTIMIGSMLLK